MNCPQCHTRMQDGFIPTTGGLFWFRKSQPHGSVEFARHLPGTFTWERRHKLQAYHCPRCQMVTFRYGRRPAETPPEEASAQAAHV